ncbi:MAG TPA: CoA transferase [Candidatus Binatia bacterium]|jgi:crotonobetainyl-CoA:carnitine CoA-transferase CaiB-like acyl-CoA transferase|nr:CoA transferase [Candidatus Binatia bacterium]
MASALDGIRIVEITQDIAGPYTGMLLAEQGAEVIKIEPPRGDRARGTPGFHVWNRSKHSVIADPLTAEGREFIHRLASTADVLLLEAQPSDEATLSLSYEDLSRDNSGLIYCHLPAFGSKGPHARRCADDTLVAAVSGLLGSQWSHRDGGVYLVIPIASYGAAFVATSAIAAALCEREHSGKGQKLEVSWLAGAFAMQTGTILYHPEMLRLFSSRMNPLGPIPVYRLYQAQDDWLFVACGNTTFWNKFCLALQQPEWVSDPRYEKAPWGITPGDRDELAEKIAPIIASKPRAEWLRILREHDVPCAPVTSRQEFIEYSQTIHNGMRVELDDPQLGKTVQMGVPVRLYQTPGTIKGPAPLLGQHTETVKTSLGQVQNSLGQVKTDLSEQRRKSFSQSERLRTADCGLRTPLDGVLVLDFASYIAGTFGPMVLAQLGANVIKVESLQGDAFRSFGFGFLGWNQGKRGLAVNLNSPEGREVVYDLVGKADVVVENLRPGATKRYGIDYDTLSQLNPRLIYATVTAFGSSGPDHDQPGFDPLLQSRSGIMRAQGGHGQPPFYLTCGVCDYAAALLTTYGVTAALYARTRTGKGQRVETSLLNAAMAVQSGSFIFYDGRPDLENGGPDLWGTGALYRIYPTANNSLFLAAVESPHWQALCETLGQRDLGQRYSFLQARQEPVEGALAAALAAVFGNKTTEEWLSLLDAAGVPCAPILPLPPLFSDEHVAANELIATHTHPQWGEVRQTGILSKFSRTPAILPYVAPLLGQHTTEVLQEIAGYGQEKIARLLNTGAIKQA